MPPKPAPITTASTGWKLFCAVMANSFVVLMQGKKRSMVKVVRKRCAVGPGLLPVPDGELHELLGNEDGASGHERVDVLLALDDGQRDVHACCRGTFLQAGCVVQERFHTAGRDVEARET